MDTATDKVEAAAPEISGRNAELAEQGFAMHGAYPLNHRLRAEALVDAGISSDPDGLIGDDLIVDTRDRVAAEAAALVAAKRELSDMKVAELRDLAVERGVNVEPNATKADLISALQPAAAPTNEG
jgi:hypothetical protein